MYHIGRINELQILKEIEYGLLLGEAGNSILLPRRFVEDQHQVGDTLEVFVCYDSEDRLVATTQSPLIAVGEAAVLKVKDLTQVGAFLDWGLDKDLFLPFSEQTSELKIGESIVVYCYVDKSDRISASMRLDRYLDKTSHDFKEGQKVSLVVAGKTELGFKVVVDRTHWGILYSDETFQRLEYGSETVGFLKKIRPDGKLDVTLTQPGHQAAVDDVGPRILALLAEEGGSLKITDKTDPEIIYRLFGVSKKKFKMALGGLYKAKKIQIGENEISLSPSFSE